MLHQSLHNIDKIEYEHHLDFSTSHRIGSNYFNQEPRRRPNRQARCGGSRNGLINTTVTREISKTKSKSRKEWRPTLQLRKRTTPFGHGAQVDLHIEKSSGGITPKISAS
jgi:hypothetical protein